MTEFTAPDPVQGSSLISALEGAGFQDVRVILSGTEVEIHGQNSSGQDISEADRAAIQTVLDAHDPDVVSAEPYAFPADGVSASTVTWRKRTATGTVTFTVNGVPTSVPVELGTAVAEITATVPGPVTVEVGTCSITLTAE